MHFCARGFVHIELIDPETGAKVIAKNLRRFIAGEPVPDMVDLSQGY